MSARTPRNSTLPSSGPNFDALGAEAIVPGMDEPLPARSTGWQPTDAHSEPVYITASGLRAVRHSDGSIGVFVDTQFGDVNSYKGGIHLDERQAEDLGRFMRTMRSDAEPRSILDEAREIIHGDREQTHGKPDRNLRAIADIWTAILGSSLKDDEHVTPQLVCLMMAGLKLARAANRPSHREHAVDTVGYMALMERCNFLDPK